MPDIQWYVAIITLPFVAIGSFAFWWFRNRFPIVDRVPALGLGCGVLVVVANLMMLVDSSSVDNQDCSWPMLTIHVVIVPFFVYAFTVRAFILMFKLAINADMRAQEGIELERTHSLSSTPSHSPSAQQRQSLADLRRARAARTASTGLPTTGTGTGTVTGGHNNTPSSSPMLPQKRIGHTSINIGGVNGTVTSPKSLPGHRSSDGASSSPKSGHGHAGQAYEFKNRDSLQDAPARQSWFTRNHHLIKSKFLTVLTVIFIALCITSWIIIAIGQQRHSCDDAPGWLHAQIALAMTCAIAGAVIMIMIARKLSQHGSSDYLGLRSEFVIVGWLILGFGAVVLPVLELIMDQTEVRLLALTIWATIIWMIMVLNPLWSVWVHYIRQGLLALEVQRIDALPQLMAIPQFAVAFGNFCNQEFTGELFAFHQRVAKFKRMATTLAVSMAAAVPNPSSPSSAALLNGSPKGNTQPLATLEESPPGPLSPVDDDEGVTLVPFSAKSPSSVGMNNHLTHSMDHTRITISAPTTTTTATTNGTRDNGVATATTTASAGLTTTTNASVAAQQGTSPIAQTLREAFAINRAFIEVDSPFEVNISAVAKKMIGERLNALSTYITATRDRRSSIGDDGTSGGARPSARVIQAAGLQPYYQANNNSINSSTANSTSHDVAVMTAIITAFDDAVTEVVKLLSHNSYQRFRSSVAYRRLIGELQNQGALLPRVAIPKAEAPPMRAWDAPHHTQSMIASPVTVQRSLHVGGNGGSSGHGNNIAPPSPPSKHAAILASQAAPLLAASSSSSSPKSARALHQVKISS